MNPELNVLFAAWSASAHLHQWSGPASDREIDAAEQSIGRPLPIALRVLYGASDGLHLLQGNLQILPLNPREEDALGLVNASRLLRDWHWPIPEELILFGGNGSEAFYGLWLPRQPKPEQRPPVIEVGEIFNDPRCLAIVGTDLVRFLKAHTTYYLMLEEEDSALDILGVPLPLRSPNPSLGPLYQWADPNIPDPEPDLFTRGLDADQLRGLYGLS